MSTYYARMTIILVILLIIPLNALCDLIKTEKVDPSQSKIIIDESIKLFKENRQYGYKMITKTFPNGYTVYIFYIPSLRGSVYVYVLNDKKEIILQKDIVMTQDNPKFDYKINKGSLIIAYQTRIAREVGPGLSAAYFERRVELYNEYQNVIFRIMGDIANHSYGEKGAAYSFYFDQTNECILKRKEVILRYAYKYWAYTGEYKNKSFLNSIKPDEQKRFSVYLNRENNDVTYNKRRSGKFTDLQIRLFMILFGDFDEDHYKKEIRRYKREANP